MFRIRFLLIPVATLAAPLWLPAENATLGTEAKVPTFNQGVVTGYTNLPPGSTVKVLEVDGDLVKIATPAGEAWVPKLAVDRVNTGIEALKRLAADATGSAESAAGIPPEFANATQDNLFEIAEAWARANTAKGEKVEAIAEESIESDKTSSAWSCRAESKRSNTGRVRIQYVQGGSGCRRTVIACPRQAPQSTSCPKPPPEAGDMYRVSTQNIRSQIVNARPDTFYVEPADYVRLKLIVTPGQIRVGTGKVYRGISIYAPAPGDHRAFNGRFTASWHDGGLKATHVFELPKSATGTLAFSANYRLLSYKQDRKSVRTPVLEPAFANRRTTTETTDPVALDTSSTCGGHRIERTFPIPEGATHFMIRPGFEGRDKGELILWNLQAQVVDGNSTKSQPPNRKGLPDGDENPPSDNELFERKVLELTNAERQKKNLPPLVGDEDLTRAARYHATDMSRDRYFSHDSMDREGDRLVKVSDPFSRIGRFHPTPNAENIARGQTAPEDVVRVWMNSSGHRANILSARAKSLGVGYVDGHWVQNFGR